MDKPFLRHQILKHKSFFFQLYKENRVSKTLNHSTDESLDFLLKFLHLIVNGRVELHSSADELIAKSLREPKLKLFESRIYLHKAVKKSREEKLKLLRQFAKLYPTFLHYVFNKD